MGTSPAAEILERYDPEQHYEGPKHGEMPGLDDVPRRSPGRAGYAQLSVVAQIFRPIGWILIIAGLVALEFAAFLFWGTGMKTAAAQSELREEFSQRQTVAAGELWRPMLGQSVARLEIPRLELDVIVIEGVGHEELTQGPGHIPETALPGSDGNSAISGHRTTYGAPFADIDRLASGDEIRVTTVQGTSAYRVTRWFLIRPDDTSVLLPLGPGEQPRIRLITCHPRFSASWRLIVEADRVSEPRL